MLINNKNLIKTIKKIDLTNEQETNLNEMKELITLTSTWALAEKI